MEITPEIIEENYEALPEVLKPFVYSEEVDASVAEIGKKYNLHIDQVGKLRNAITFVVLAVLKAEDFSAEIQKELGLPAEEVGKIVEDVNVQIFSKIREALADYGEEDGESLESETLTTPSPDKYREGVGENEKNTNYELRMDNADANTLQNAGIKIDVEPKGQQIEAPMNLPIGDSITNEEDKNTLVSAGIALAPEQKIVEEKRSPEMSTEKIMAGISNPDSIPMEARVVNDTETKPTTKEPEAPKLSVIESKLAGTFSIPKTQTEHTIGKVTEPTKTPNIKTDPYREAV